MRTGRGPILTLAGALAGRRYEARWFNPRTGQWADAAVELTADAAGRIALPAYPGATEKSEEDWAMKVRVVGR